MNNANSTSLEQYEVWFLTGSQHLYGEDVLKQVAAQSQEIAAALNASSDVPVKLVWKPVLTDSDAIRRTALEANSDDSVIGVIAWMHTFSPAKMWIAGLDALRTPLLHLHTQANVELPWGGIDMDFMNLNQAAHGDREFGYIQSRLGVARKTVVGHVSHPVVQAKVATWVRAAAGLHRLGLEPEHARSLPLAMMVPAPGQGCLAVQTRDDDEDTIAAVAPLDHAPSHRALDAERSLMWRLGGGCALPLGAHAVVGVEAVSLTAIVATPDGTTVLRVQTEGGTPEDAAMTAARELIDLGAERILAEVDAG